MSYSNWSLGVAIGMIHTSAMAMDIAEQMTISPMEKKAVHDYAVVKMVTDAMFANEFPKELRDKIAQTQRQLYLKITCPSLMAMTIANNGSEYNDWIKTDNPDIAFVITKPARGTFKFVGARIDLKNVTCIYKASAGLLVEVQLKSQKSYRYQVVDQRDSDKCMAAWNKSGPVYYSKNPEAIVINLEPDTVL